MTDTLRTRWRPYAVFPLRLALAVVFVLAGWGKLTGFQAWTSAVAGLGFPVPTVTAALVAVGEFAGGLGLALGVLARFSAAVHAAIMAVALLVVRLFGGDPAGWRLDLALLAGALTIVLHGPGRPTVWSTFEELGGRLEERVRAAWPRA
jgi:putative oxidoreductase